MDPSKVRSYVLRDHVDLRARLDRVEAQAKEVERGATGRCPTLVKESEALLKALATHMEWEDIHLAAALRDADAWGPEREERLRSDHREQRAILEDVVATLHRSSGVAALVAQKISDFVALVRADLEEEEEALLGADVLRDDVIGIGVEAG